MISQYSSDIVQVSIISKKSLIWNNILDSKIKLSIQLHQPT